MKDYKGALDELERLREYATATNEAIDSLHELRERFGWSGGGWKAKAEQAVSANDALRGNYERALDKIGELEESNRTLRELDASEPEHCCGLQGFGEPRDTCPACALDGDGVGEEK